MLSLIMSYHGGCIMFKDGQQITKLPLSRGGIYNEGTIVCKMSDVFGLNTGSMRNITTPKSIPSYLVLLTGTNGNRYVELWEDEMMELNDE